MHRISLCLILLVACPLLLAVDVLGSMQPVPAAAQQQTFAAEVAKELDGKEEENGGGDYPPMTDAQIKELREKSAPIPKDFLDMQELTAKISGGEPLDSIKFPSLDGAYSDPRKLTVDKEVVVPKLAASAEKKFLEAVLARLNKDGEKEAAVVFKQLLTALNDGVVTKEEFTSLAHALLPNTELDGAKKATGTSLLEIPPWRWWVHGAWYIITVIIRRPTSHLALWTMSEPCCATRAAFGWYAGWDHRLTVRYAHVGTVNPVAAAPPANVPAQPPGAVVGVNRNGIDNAKTDLHNNLNPFLVAQGLKPAAPVGAPYVWNNDNIVNQLKPGSGAPAPLTPRNAAYDATAQTEIDNCFNYLAGLPHGTNSDEHDQSTHLNQANRGCMAACALAHGMNAAPGYVRPGTNNNIHSCSIGLLTDRAGAAHRLLAFSSVAPGTPAPQWLAGVPGGAVSWETAAPGIGVGGVLDHANALAQYTDWHNIASKGNAAAWSVPPVWPNFYASCSEDRVVLAASLLR